MIDRRSFLCGGATAITAAVAGCKFGSPAGVDSSPVIVTTDLYHPAQDVGDNIDLVAAYALCGPRLLGVLLDCTDEYRAVHKQGNPNFFDRSGNN